MALDATTGLGAMTGARYIESWKDGREVWLDGEKVTDVTEEDSEKKASEIMSKIYWCRKMMPLDISGRAIQTGSAGGGDQKCITPDLTVSFEGKDIDLLLAVADEQDATHAIFRSEARRASSGD